MLLSALFVRYRDVKPIWEVVLQVLFYASPIFYPIDVVVGALASSRPSCMMLNPFAAILQQARHALIAPSHPSASEAIGGAAAAARHRSAIGVGVIALGYRVFSRRAPHIAEEL